MAELLFPGELLQPANETWVDRYPDIFRFIEKELGGRKRPRVLSYGCSTGEEVWSLRRLLPQAQIVGADINPNNVARCRARLASNPDPAIEFVCCGSPAELPAEPFDAILCLAVLRHADLQRDRPDNCSRIVPFARVDALVTGLAKRLAQNGLLAITNCHFRFIDMTAAAGFETALDLPETAPYNDPLYGPDERRLRGAQCSEAIFRKLGDIRSG